MRTPPFLRPIFLSAVLGLVLHASRSLAEESPPAKGAMDLAACVREALLANPAVQGASAASSAAEEGAAAAGAAFLPEAGLSLTSRRFESRAFLPSGLSALTGSVGGLAPVVGPVDQHAYTLRASYTLFDGGRRKARRGEAEAAAETVRAEGVRTRADLVREVHRAYYGLLLAEESLRVAAAHRVRSADHLRLAEERHRAGAVPLLDVLRARVLAAEAEVGEIRASTSVAIARGVLNALLGRFPESPLEIVPLPEEEAGSPLPPQEEILESAATERPEVAAARKRREAALFRLSEARSALFPTVRMEASYGRLDQRFFPADRDGSVGLTLTLPLFTGFARGHEIRKARFEALSAEKEERARVLAVRREAYDAYRRVEEARAARKAVRNLVRQAEESLRMARERYAVGAGTAGDLLDAETSLLSARQAEAEALFQERLARTELQRAAGRLGIEGAS